MTTMNPSDNSDRRARLGLEPCETDSTSHSQLTPPSEPCTGTLVAMYTEERVPS